MITELIMDFLVAAMKIDEKIAPKMYSVLSYLTIYGKRRIHKQCYLVEALTGILGTFLHGV